MRKPGCAFWAIFALASSLFFGQNSIDACRSSSENQQFRQSLLKSSQPVELLRKELAAVPDDLFLNRWLIDNKQTGKGSLAGEYRSKLDEHPGSPLFLYLYGLALIGGNTPEAIEQLNRAIAADPKLPWTYYALVEVYSSPNFKDTAKVAQNLLAFTNVCPSVLAAYNFLPSVENRETLRELTSRFRRAVEGQSASSVAASYRRLWAAEFRATDPRAYDTLRTQVAKDIQRVKQLDPENAAVLREGYKLIGDSAAANAIPIQEKLRGPKNFSDVIQAWFKDHPYPENDASSEGKDEFYKKLSQASEEWVKKWPDEPNPLYWHLISLADVMGTPNEAVEQAGDTLLRNLKEHPFKGYSVKPYQASIAEIWIERNIRLEQCLQLAEEALAEIDHGPTFLKPANDMQRDTRAQFLKAHALQVSIGRFDTLGIEADAARKLKRFDKARAAISDMKRRLDDNPGDDPHQTYVYLSQSALLADAEGHKPDALTYYQLMFNQLTPSAQEKTPALALWKEMGGTDDGFKLWSSMQPWKKPSVASQASAWSDMNKPLAELAASSMNGKSWNITDLKGKATLISVWATWCMPCRDELPNVQKLYDQVKDRTDIQVVSISIDTNPGDVAPFLKEAQYTFPVLLPQPSYVEALVGEVAIPRTWIVDPNGVLRSEKVGYDPADWPQGMLQRLMSFTQKDRQTMAR